MENVCRVLSTFFGTGLISKKMPGTVGSFFASVICLFLCGLNINYFLEITILLFVVGIMSCQQYISKYSKDGDADPGYIVIDEACGIFLGACILQHFGHLSVVALAINFVLFRIIDIFKPFPIKNVETFCKAGENLAGFGIMIDDIMASVVATSVQVIVCESFAL